MQSVLSPFVHGLDFGPGDAARLNPAVSPMGVASRLSKAHAMALAAVPPATPPPSYCLQSMLACASGLTPASPNWPFFPVDMTNCGCIWPPVAPPAPSVAAAAAARGGFLPGWGDLTRSGGPKSSPVFAAATRFEQEFSPQYTPVPNALSLGSLDSGFAPQPKPQGGYAFVVEAPYKLAY